MTNKTHDARAIANYILDLAPEYGIENVTLMQLLKLVYLSHGWSFAFSETPLVAQSPQAWQYGPVYPHIYRALGKYGSTPIRERIKQKETGLPYSADLSSYQKSVIDAVMETYGKMHAFQLSGITHQSGSPWDETMEKQGIYKEIPPHMMETYYKNLAKQRGIESL